MSPPKWGSEPGPDRALIRRCRKGDARAWRELLNKYERLVFSIPLRYGLSREDAADLSQVVFTILMQSIDDLPDDSRLGPWLATVTRRHAWRFMERNRRERPAVEEDVAGSATLVGGDPDDPVERWETLEWIHAGLSLLSDRCRELITALYLAPEPLSYAAAAEQFGMPIGSIGPTRARCLKDLRAAMTSQGRL